MAYTYKVWIVDGKEHFEYGNGQTRKKDFPFEESLMKLLYLDIWSFADLFEGSCMKPRSSSIPTTCCLR